MQSRYRSLIYLLLPAAVLIIFLRLFFIKTYVVDSSSMEPYLMEGDQVIALNTSILPISFRRYQTVIFTRGITDMRKKYYIKRIMGLPGEYLSIKSNQLKVNRTSVKNSLSRVGFSSTLPQEIPQNHYYLLGDNRENSLDSRRYGPVPKTNLVGLALLRYFPLSRISLIK